MIVEDVPATAAYLAGLLVELCGSGSDIETAGTLAAAREALVSRSRSFVLVDIGLPDGNGIELIAWLHVHCPSATSLVVSAWGDEEIVIAALRAGATGYLFKERDVDELRYALQCAQRGGAPIDPFVARRVLDLMTRDVVPLDFAPLNVTSHALTHREREILSLVERGCSNREIAEATGLSQWTVATHTKAIYRKLAVGSRTEAVFEAKARGLLP